MTARERSALADNETPLTPALHVKLSLEFDGKRPHGFKFGLQAAPTSEALIRKTADDLADVARETYLHHFDLTHKEASA